MRSFLFSLSEAHIPHNKTTEKKRRKKSKSDLQFLACKTKRHFCILSTLYITLLIHPYQTTMTRPTSRDLGIPAMVLFTPEFPATDSFAVDVRESNHASTTQGRTRKTSHRPPPQRHHSGGQQKQLHHLQKESVVRRSSTIKLQAKETRKASILRRSIQNLAEDSLPASLESMPNSGDQDDDGRLPHTLVRQRSQRLRRASITQRERGRGMLASAASRRGLISSSRRTNSKNDAGGGSSNGSGGGVGGGRTGGLIKSHSVYTLRRHSSRSPDPDGQQQQQLQQQPTSHRHHRTGTRQRETMITAYEVDSGLQLDERFRNMNIRF